MQIIFDKNSGVFILFTRWGYIGAPGQMQHTPFPTLEAAIKEFSKIFQQKVWIDGNLLIEGLDWLKFISSHQMNGRIVTLSGRKIRSISWFSLMQVTTSEVSPWSRLISSPCLCDLPSWTIQSTHSCSQSPMRKSTRWLINSWLCPTSICHSRIYRNQCWSRRREFSETYWISPRKSKLWGQNSLLETTCRKSSKSTNKLSSWVTDTTN